MPTVTKAAKTLYSLQLLRFIAALFVIFFHLELMESGYKGVDIFFVISGFVMYYSTFITGQNNKAVFAINRLTKIYLLYWIVLMLLYFIRPYNIDKSFFNTIFLLPGHHSILGVSWSLSYELYFYFLFWIAVYVINSKFRFFIFLFALVISTSVTFLNTTSVTVKGSALNFLAGQNLWEFLLGISCAGIFKKYTIPQHIAIFGTAVTGLRITISSIAYTQPISYVVYGILSFMLIAFLSMLEKTATVNNKTASVIKIAGDASYSMYLAGPVIIAIILPGSFVLKILTIFVILIVSIFINVFLEKRLLSSMRKVLFAIIAKRKIADKGS